jgi:hypothetical protein
MYTFEFLNTLGQLKLRELKRSMFVRSYLKRLERLAPLLKQDKQPLKNLLQAY